ncbi:MAG: hypothetical protein MUC50_19755, partial [Myxococcota bacterium]|nr:hypothetical protein [Myxococcota bacterium]
DLGDLYRWPDLKKIPFSNESMCLSLASNAGLAEKGYKDLTAALKHMDVKLPVTYFQGRYDYHSSVTPGVGPFGNWTSWAMCPAGQYAIGYKMRVEPSLGSDGDDTALNAVELTCANFDRTQTSLRSPHPGYWGIWQPEARCARGPMNGMQIRIEPRQGSDADDTGANDLKATCVSGGNIHAPGGGVWGNEGVPTFCPAGSAICGARIQIETPQSSGSDDTSMNGIDLACCAY